MLGNVSWIGEVDEAEPSAQLVASVEVYPSDVTESRKWSDEVEVFFDEVLD